MRALVLLGLLAACRSPAQPAASVDARGDVAVDARVEPGPTIGLRLARPGASAVDMERALSPVEAALRSAPGLARVEGAAAAGAARLEVTFRPGTTAADAGRSVADLARPAVPQEMTVEVVPAARWDLRFTLRSDRLSPIEAREIIERIVLPRLARVPGVAETSACGGARREAHVILDAARLVAAGLGLRDVTAALARTALYASPEELGAVRAATRAGVPLRVSDFARIEVGGAPSDCWVASPAGMVGVGGRAAVADVGALVAGDAALEGARPELPAGVAIERVPGTSLRLTVRAPAGTRPPELARIVAALRDAAPATVAWIYGSGEIELLAPAGSVDAVARALAQVPMVGPVRTPDDEIRIAVAGADLEPLAAAADAVRAAVASVPGVAAAGTVGASPRAAPRVDVRPDAAALARVGLRPPDLDDYVAAAREGIPAARLRDGDRDIAVVVRFPDARDDPTALARLAVPARGGAIPLASLAQIAADAEPREILHRDGERVALVWVRAAGGADRRALVFAVWGAASSARRPAGVRLLRP